MSTLIQEKVAQAIEILNEQKIDCWLTFVRETSAAGDPVLPLIYGHDLTWQSALILSRTGERIAIVGHYEMDTVSHVGAYGTILGYHQSIRADLLSVLERLNPQQIALNYSTNDVGADGLTYGMYQVLLGYLESTPFAERLLSAEGIIAALRGRKTEGEVERIRAAIETTGQIYARTFDHIQPGMTEREISAFMHTQLAERGLEPAWEFAACPIVNTGPDSVVGHAAPSDLMVERGHIVHLDFGVKQDDFCSDIQRVLYMLAPGESAPPEAVQRGFDTVVRAIQAAVAAMRPGVTGQEVDAVARKVITDAGYPEYLYATGHHLGRAAHDGGGILGPTWERYGNLPHRPLEAGHVYTVEPGLAVPGYGYIGLEEDVLVTDEGAVYLGEPQTTLLVR